MNGAIALKHAKSYTDESLLGGGAVVGKNVTISSITPIEGGNKVTFSYTLDDGTVKTSSMNVMDGKDGIDGLPGKDGSDGVGISKIEKISTVDLVDTYRITFTDNSTFDYEIKNGKDGQGGTGGSGEENKINSISVNGVNVAPDENKNVDITVPEAYDDTAIRTEIANKADTDHTHTTVNGHTVESDVPVDAKFTDTVYDDTQVKTQIQAVANGLMDSVGYSADYKTIDIIAKNGVKKSVNVAPIISHASITELSDVDTTNKATGKALVYNATTNKHEYADVSSTDEKVKMDASTDAKYLGELLDNITIANENGELKVKKLDGQEVTITEINYLKGLTMNVMDLVNMFSNGGVKIINTPVATYAELLTLDKSSFIEGISYLVYVLADENHDNAKTTYLVDKDSETPTYFGFADSQRDFTTNPIDLATEITGKLGIANMDSDAIKALFTVDDTYKTETATNNAFSTHGAKALYDELLLAIGNKANDSDLTAHKDDTDIHVSTEDRTKWDSAKTHADSAHAPSNAQANVLETVKVNNQEITPDENKAVNIDLSDYAKTADIPTTLPANGGNADTVNNHTVETDVPTDAVFTDTTYSDATQIEHGLMSVDDKKKLDGLTKYTPDGTTITADEDGTLHGVKVTVDTALSPTSTNPVQNKVVKAYVDKKVSENVDFSTSTSKTLNDTVEAPLVLSNSTRNLLNPMLKTNTSNGVTCTNNGDGTYTLNGTSTKDRWLSFGYVTLKPGKYKFIATKNNVRVNNLCVSLNSTVIAMPGEIFTVQSKGVYDIGLSTYNKTLNNVVIKPMLTTDLNATYDDFVPYSGYDIKTCGKNIVGNPSDLNNPTVKDGIITFPAKSAATIDTYLRLYSDVDISVFDTFRVVVESINEYINNPNESYVIIKTKGKKEFSTFTGTSFESSANKYVSNVFNCSDFGNKIDEITVVVRDGYAYPGGSYKVSIFNGEDKEFSNWVKYVESSVYIDSSTEFPLLGLKSFDGITNIISPGNVNVTYAKSDSGKAILDMSENKLDKGNVVNNQTTTDAGFVLDARQANPNIDGTLAKQVNDLNGKLSIASDVRKETTVNLLNLTLQTTTQNGLTCTNNGDGTYTLNGTAANQTTFIFANADYTLATFKGHSSLKLVGFPKKYASAGVLQVWRQSDNLIMRDRGDGVIITGSDMPYGNCNMAFVIYEGAVTDGMIIKPMLTTNLNATYDDFVPYTGDGDTLTEDVAEIKKDLGGLTFSASGTTLSITDGTHTWTLEANS